MLALAGLGGGGSSSSSATSSSSQPSDTTAPVYESLAVDTQNNTITVTYDSTLDSSNGPNVSDFVVSQSSGSITVSSATVSGKTLVLQLASAINTGQNLTIAYSDPSAANDTNAIQDAAGNDAADLNKVLAAGVVVDGYISGATVFIDVNGNGVFDSGDVDLGATDANGNFIVPDGVSGTVIATGGINIDTGLPNTIALKAPEGATVINPLTTLVQSYSDSYSVSAADASAAVAQALGLSSELVSNDLLSFDPIGANNAIVQKAAAQIATVLTLVKDNAGSDAAVQGVISNLVGDIKAAADASSTTDILTDNTKLTNALADQVSSGLSALVSDTLTANTAIKNATSIAEISQAQSDSLDDIAPNAASTLAIATTSDTGIKGDNLTSDATPSITFSFDTTDTAGGALVAGDVAKLYAGSDEVGSYILTTDDIAAGSAAVQISSNLTDAAHSLSVKLVDKAGNISAASDSLSVTIDTQAPPTVVTIAGLSDDTGNDTAGSGSDYITSNSSQTISLTLDAALADDETLYGSLDGGDTWTDLNSMVSSTAVSWTGVTLASAQDMQFKVVDAAGNTSTPVVQSYVYDNVASDVSFSDIAITPDNGTSASDGITNDTGVSVSASLSASLAANDIVKGTIDGTNWVDITSSVSGINVNWTGVTLASSGTIQLKVIDVAGNEGTAASFAYQVDQVAPSHVETVINASTKTVTLTYDEALDSVNVPAADQFSVTMDANGTATTNVVNSVNVSGTSVELLLTNSMIAGDITIAYSDATVADDASGVIQDVAGNDAADYSATIANGVVIDGYISGSHIFIDTDGDQSYTGGTDASLGYSDANGLYFLADTSTTGTYVATGGTNIDTGLPNNITLLAPTGATVINPFTTLVVHYVASDSAPTTDAAVAATQIKTILGLNVDLDLLTYDPLAAGDNVGIATQKVAAQIATIFTMAHDYPADGLSANQAQDQAISALVGELIAANAASTALNLNNAVFIDTLTANLSSIPNQIAAAMSSLDSASSYAGISAAQSNVMDETAPAMLGAIDLVASSDTGSSNSDNLTIDTTPTFRVSLESQAKDGTSHVAGDTITLYDASSVVASQILTASDIANGYTEITSSALTSAAHSITAKATDVAGNQSALSSVLTLNVNTQAPTLTITDDQANESDSGAVTFTLSFSDAMYGMAESLLSFTGGNLVANSLTGGDGDTQFTVQATPDAGQESGSLGLSLDGADATVASTLLNAAGMPLAASRITHSQDYDTAGPLVSSVTAPSTGTFGAGDTIEFVVTFAEAINIDGVGVAPSLSITVGSDSRSVTNPVVSNNTLTFTYTVTNADGASGTGLTIDALAGEVNDEYGNTSTAPALNGVATTSNLIIDGAASGQGADGYLSGVTIFADNDNSGELSAGDSVAIANDTGGFAIYGASGAMIMYGGEDISTGLSFNVQYEAPSDYTVINPISSLIRAVQKAGTDITNDVAWESVQLAMFGDNTTGPSNTAVASYDPFGVAANTEVEAEATSAVAYQRIAAAVATVVEVLSQGTAALGITASQRQASVDMFDYLASNLPVDGSLMTLMQDTTFLTSMATEALTAADQGDSASSAQISSATTILQAAIAQIDAAGGSSPISQLTEIAKVQLVAQGEAGDQLEAWLDGSAESIEMTPESMGTAAQDASVGVIVPVSYAISAHAANGALLEGQTGETVEHQFVISRGGNTSVASTIEYEVTGGEQLLGNLFEAGSLPSGSISFAAGEESRALIIATQGNDSQQASLIFKVSLFDSTGMAQIDGADGYAFSQIVDDDPFIPLISMVSSVDLASGADSAVGASVDYYDAQASLTVTVSVIEGSVSDTTFTGNLAQVNSFLQTLTVNPSVGSSQTSLELSVAVDGTNKQASNNLDISIHNAPTVQTQSSSIDVTAGQLGVANVFAVSDVDSAQISAYLRSDTGLLAVDSDVLTNSGAALNQLADGVLIMGSANQVNTALQGLQFTAEAGTSSAAITMVVDDGDSLTSNASQTITVGVAAAAPELTLPTITNAVTLAKASAIQGLQVADSDSDNLLLTLAAAEGSLAAAAQGLAVVTGGGSGTLTIEGSAADINATIAKVRFTADADATAPALTATLADGDSNTLDPTAQPIPLVIIANAPPQEGGDITSATTLTEDDSDTSITVTGINLTDDDGTVATDIRILSLQGATLDSGILIGPTGSLIDVSGGNLSLNVTPIADYDQDISITYAVVDGAINTLNSLPSTITIAMSAVNDAPNMLPTTGSFSFVEGGDSAAIGANLALYDIDSSKLSSATVSIASAQIGDVLQIATLPSGVASSFSNGVLTLTGDASLADYESALRQLTYSNTSDAPVTGVRNITIEVTDAEGGNSATGSVTRSVTVAGVNDAPEVSNSTDAISFTEGGSASLNSVSLADAESDQIASATITFAAGFRPDQDSLVVGGSLPSAISASVFDLATATLTLTGDASLADYETALALIEYQNSSDNPSAAVRSLAVQVMDVNGGIANADWQNISVTSVADAPSLDLNGSAAGTNASASFIQVLYPDGIAVATGASLSDVDSQQIAALTIVLDSNGASNDGLALSEGAQAVALVSGISVDASVANTLTLSGDSTVANYEKVLQGLLFTHSFSGVDVDADIGTSRIISITATDANDNDVRSAAATINVDQQADPLAAVSTSTLSLSGDPGTSAVIIDLSSMLVSGGNGRIKVAGDALFTAVDVDASALTVATTTIVGVETDNIIIGSAQADTIMGAGGADTINAGAGDDVVYYQAGSSIDGGSDNDTLLVRSSFNLKDLSDITNFEAIDASQASAGISLQGDASGQSLTGSAFADIITAADGDTLVGNGGEDTFEIAIDTSVTVSDISLGDRIQTSVDLATLSASIVNNYSNGTGTVTLTGWDSDWSFSLVADSADIYQVVKVPVQTPTITGMSKDTGSKGDWLTSDGAAGRMITGSLDATLAAGEVVQVLTDASGDWANAISANTVGTSWSAADNNVHYDDFDIQVRIYNTDSQVAGYGGIANQVVQQAVTLDTSVAALVLELTSDTGLDGDLYTNDASLTIGNQEANAQVQYSLDDSTWLGTAPAAATGDNTVYVRQVDTAGNVSLSTSLSFTLDQTAPDAPVIALSADSGGSGDFITNNAAISATAEANGSIEYYSGIWGAGSWVSEQPVATNNSNNTVYVRQLDLAGNASAATSLSFYYDSVAPANLALGLNDDTGDVSDYLTADGQVNIANNELGALWEYSTDGGASFMRGSNTSFSLQDGVYSVGAIQVRQTDGAGNQSDVISNAQAWQVDSQGPEILATTPADNTNIGENDALGFAVSENVVGMASKYVYLYKTVAEASDELVESFAANTLLASPGKSISISPASALSAGESYYILMDAGAFEDAAGSGTAAIDDVTAWDFEVTSFSISIDVISTDDIVDSGDTVSSIAVSGSIASNNSALLDGITADGVVFTPSTGSISNLVIADQSNGARTWSANLDLQDTVDQQGITLQVTATVDDTTPFDITSVRRFDKDTQITDPVVNLALDTALSDGITSLGTVTVTNLEAGASWYYTTDGTDPSDSANGARIAGAGNQFTLAEGDYAVGDIRVFQQDSAENASAVASNAIAWAIDQTISTATLTMPVDNADSTNDGISSNNTVTVSGLVAGDTLLFSDDGGANWQQQTIADGISSLDIELDNGTYAAGDVQVQQIDTAGNKSQIVKSSVSITIDAVAPDAPVIHVVSDDDRVNAIDKAASIVVTGTAEAGSDILVEWDLISHSVALASDATNWSVTFTSSQIPTTSNNISVTATDVAGNASTASVRSVTVDVSAPGAPSINGFSPTGTTGYAAEANVSTGTIDGTAEANSSVELFVNQASNAAFTTTADANGDWQVAYEGWQNGSFSVVAKATDTFGNTGVGSTAAVLTMDNEATAPTIDWVDSGLVGDGVTNDGTVTIGSLEEGASWQYSTNGGTDWLDGADQATTFDLAEDSYGYGDIRVRQTDSLGNQSEASSLDINLLVDTSVADPSLSLFTDTGVAGNDDSFSDGITRVGKMGVTGLEAGASWQFSDDAGSTWSALKTATSSSSEFVLGYDPSTTTTFAIGDILVRQTDAAGNQSIASIYASLVQVNLTDPTVTIDVDAGQLGLIDTAKLNNVDGNTATINIDFSETPNGFSIDDLTFEGGTITNLVVDASDDSIYTATITADDDRNVDGRLVVKSGWTDLVGNTGTQAQTDVFIDTSNPVIDKLSSSWDGGNGTDVAITPVINASENDAAEGALLTIDLDPTDGAEDGQAVTLQITDASGAIHQLAGADTATAIVTGNQAELSISQADIASLSEDETYTISVDVDDATGNQASTHSSYTFTVDRVAPVIETVAASWGDYLLAAEVEADQAVTITTSGLEDAQDVMMLLNGITYTEAVINNTVTIAIPVADLQALVDGQPYDLTVNVSDAAGNPATTFVTPQFDVDISIPEITAVTASWGARLNIAEAAASDGAIVVQTGEGAGADVTVTVDGVDYSGTTVDDGSATIAVANLTALAEGEYTITANVNDIAGNPAISHASTAFTVDLTQPSIVFSEQDGALELQPGDVPTIVLQLNEMSDDFDPETMILAHHGELSNMVVDEANLTVSFTYTPDAMKTFNGSVEILADSFTDLAGNPNTASHISFAGTTWQVTSEAPTDMGDTITNLTSSGDVVDLGLGDDEINISAGDDFIDGGDGYDALVLPTAIYPTPVASEAEQTLQIGGFSFALMPDGEVVVTHASNTAYDTTLYNMEAVSVGEQMINLTVHEWQPVDNQTQIDGTPWQDSVTIDLDSLLGADVTGSLSLDESGHISSDSDANVDLQMSKSNDNIIISDSQGTTLMLITEVEEVVLTTDSTSSDELAINPATDLV